jgi:hypothetical protein
MPNCPKFFLATQLPLPPLSGYSFINIDRFGKRYRVCFGGLVLIEFSVNCVFPLPSPSLMISPDALPQACWLDSINRRSEICSNDLETWGARCTRSDSLAFNSSLFDW